MDTAGGAAIRASVIRFVILAVLLSPKLSLAQVPSDPTSQKCEQLLGGERWQEAVTLAESARSRSADIDYCYGSALAHLQRWDEARRVFEAAEELQPRDKRFPTELGGVAFKQHDYAGAKRYLRQALQLDPADSYANDFLGTIYFLESNVDAALKYWNRIGKPRISAVKSDPEPHVDAQLLDRAIAVSPASVLERSELSTSQARVDGLGIFPIARFDLQAREDGKFDLVFHNWERNGWGSNKWQALFGIFRGLPFQTIYPEFYNIDERAINIKSLIRWDAQKRRALASVSGPLQGNPKRRVTLTGDLRGENWDVVNSFTGPAESFGSLNLRRESLAGAVTSIENERWTWSAAAEISHRDFRSVLPGSVLTSSLLAKGYQLKQTSQVNVKLFTVPEKRMSLIASGAYEAGRLWSAPDESFLKLEPKLHFDWLPQAKGDDYHVQHELRGGKTFGDVPFDELFMLGVERDNDLWMRGHIGTRDGRKGSAPLGRNFFLSNWELDKNVYDNGIVDVKLGPFVDTGKITDPVAGLGSEKWLWDMGVQAKFRLFGVGFGFSYGKDLRSGNNAFYVTMKP